jgi:nucleotide-binding universal stress UspA family protein
MRWKIRRGRIGRWTLVAVILSLAWIGFLHLTRGTAVRHVRGVTAGGAPISVSEPEFPVMATMATGAWLAPGNRVEVTLNGDGTYPRLWDDLRSAQQSITLQLYYGAPGRMADMLGQILRERARAGVRVFVLYDAFGTVDMPATHRDELRAAGIVVEPFRPIRLSTLHLAQKPVLGCRRGHWREHMTLRGPVLVGTDLSAAAEEALRQGAQLADDLSSTLLVCHVIPVLLPDITLFADFRRAHGQIEDSILVKARDAVQQQLDAVLKTRGARVEVALEYGTPHVGLLSTAEQKGAGVIAVGPGATALDVVRHAAGAVLVTRPSPHGPVVGATDFSDPSMPALHVAASEAQRRGVPLHLLHAFDLDVFAERRAPATAMPYLDGKSWIALEGLDELRATAKRRLDELLRDAGVPGEVALVTGSGVEVIVQHAETIGAELVVLGTHGRSAFKRLTLGSTAASVVERAPCSVLVVRLAAA